MRGHGRRFGMVRGTAWLVLAGTLIVATACGGKAPAQASSENGAWTTGTASPLAGGTTQATPLAFASCLRTHGVPKFPDPSSTGRFPDETLQGLGVSQSQFAAAQKACRDLSPSSMRAKLSRKVIPLTAQQKEDYVKAAACMRSHGITNFPDPTFGTSVTFHIPSSIDPHSAEVTQATQTCQKLIPAGLPYSGSD